jgi:hypothetical protein
VGVTERVTTSRLEPLACQAFNSDVAYHNSSLEVFFTDLDACHEQGLFVA